MDYRIKSYGTSAQDANVSHAFQLLVDELRRLERRIEALEYEVSQLKQKS